MRRLLLPLVFLALLPGCGDGAERKQDIDYFDLSWEKMPDGSLFARGPVLDSGARGAARCWRESKGYDCVYLAENRTGVSNFFVSSEFSEDLPSVILPLPVDDGYSCYDMVLGDIEKISRRGSILTSNNVRENGAWDEGFIHRFMAENGVEGRSDFNCLGVLEIVSRGSLDTLGTSAIDKRAIY
tara:strand:+ start:904 stop:1455 length:552 start_codon:yes stop_codon:yes gene_type:complete